MLVVDETSMVNVLLMNNLLQASEIASAHSGAGSAHSPARGFAVLNKPQA